METERYRMQGNLVRRIDDHPSVPSRRRPSSHAARRHRR
jgi:hypothetical protein